VLGSVLLMPVLEGFRS